MYSLIKSASADITSFCSDSTESFTGATKVASNRDGWNEGCSLESESDG